MTIVTKERTDAFIDRISPQLTASYLAMQREGATIDELVAVPFTEHDGSVTVAVIRRSEADPNSEGMMLVHLGGPLHDHGLPAHPNNWTPPFPGPHDGDYVNPDHEPDIDEGRKF